MDLWLWFMGRWMARYVGETTVGGAHGRGPLWWDWALAFGLGVAVVAEVALGGPSWPGALLVTGLVAAVAVTYRRRFTLVAVLSAFAVQFVVEVASLTRERPLEVTAGQMVAGLVLVYALCRWLTFPRLVVGMGVVLALVLPVEVIAGGWGGGLSLMVVWLVPAVLALAMRYRARLAEQRIREVRLLERNALARELHDTVAHHVSAIAVQAQAAGFVAGSRPEQAREAIGNIESIANQAMDEMRRMVGILRSGGQGGVAGLGEAVVPPDLTALGGPEGLPTVTVSGDTDLGVLPAHVAGALYRIAQESVTNARRHSRGVTSVEVDLRIRGREAHLEIVNDGQPDPAPGSGYGLIGMGERAEAVGGHLEAGPLGRTGWRVQAVIPLVGPR